MTRYADFLDNEGKKQTTIAIHLRTLRAIINEARRAGLIKESQYPFGRGRYEIQSGAGRKMALTVEQIGQIANYDDGSEATARYRDYWLFLYLCNGINVADFVKLRYRDIVNGEICFVRQKTERTTRVRKEIRAIITDRMQKIIDRWGTVPTRCVHIRDSRRFGRPVTTNAQNTIPDTCHKQAYDRCGRTIGDRSYLDIYGPSFVRNGAEAFGREYRLHIRVAGALRSQNNRKLFSEFRARRTAKECGIANTILIL